MLGITRRHLFQAFLLLMFCVGLVSVALIYFFPAPPSTITIATGPKGSAYERIAERYRDLLAKSGVTLVIRPTTGSMENLSLLQDADADVQLALVQGGVILQSGGTATCQSAARMPGHSYLSECCDSRAQKLSHLLII